MLTTNNLGLKKPEGTDVVDINDINGNMDKLDAEVVKKASTTEDGRMSKGDKAKLDGIANGANKYVHPSTHTATMIIEDSSHRFVTDAEKTNWNSAVSHKSDTVKHITNTERSLWNTVTKKVDKVTGRGLSTNDYTTAEKNKLASLKNYSHPSTHPATMIVEDSNHKFVTQAEKNNWNSKAPGGYGIGGTAKDISNQNLNNYINSGFYRGYNMANAPTDDWYYIEVIQHASTWVLQIATRLHTDLRFFRRNSSGTWQAWKKILTQNDYDQLFQSVSSGKNQLETAITGKDGTVSKSSGIATFNELKAGIQSIPQARGNATTANVLSGKTFTSAVYGASQKSGTMPNQGAKVITPGTTNKAIPAGYHNGGGYILGSNNLVSSNIREGVNIFGVTGSIKKLPVWLCDFWVTAANMPTKRNQLTSSAVGNIIYVIGGHYVNYYSKNEAYNTVTNTWSTKANMPTARSRSTSSAVGNIVYVFGGNISCGLSDKNEAYNTVTNTWSTKANMSTERNSLTSSVVDKIVYVMGGYNSSGSKNEAYNTVTNTWSTKANIPSGRYGSTSSAIGNIIYVIGGGDSSSDFSKNEAYNTVTNTWSTKADMPTGRYGLTSSAVGNIVYVIGGINYTTKELAKNEAYNTITNTWSTEADMFTERNYLTSSTVSNIVYVIGGKDTKRNLNKNEIYVPERR